MLGLRVLSPWVGGYQGAGLFGKFYGSGFSMSGSGFRESSVFPFVWGTHAPKDAGSSLSTSGLSDFGLQTSRPKPSDTCWLEGRSLAQTRLGEAAMPSMLYA